jgi:hypothetical protein
MVQATAPEQPVAQARWSSAWSVPLDRNLEGKAMGLAHEMSAQSILLATRGPQASAADHAGRAAILAASRAEPEFFLA